MLRQLEVHHIIFNRHFNHKPVVPSIAFFTKLNKSSSLAATLGLAILTTLVATNIITLMSDLDVKSLLNI
jgi:hypothetical protein